jgi:hypothetical protein
MGSYRIGQILRADWFVEWVIEGKVEGRAEVTGRQRRRRKYLLDELKTITSYSAMN